MLTSQKIVINKLFFRYGASDVLSNLTLSFKRGGFYLIIGPNGGGKTTFLKLLMGLLTPTSGTVSLFGETPYAARAKIGYVPQTYHFDMKFPITVSEFVLMGALSKLSWWGGYPKPIRERSCDRLQTLGIADLKNTPIGEISGGQRQRAALARALMDDPDLLLLDEPTTGLDPQASEIIQKELKHLKGQKTILMVTHTIPKFLDLVDEIVCIRTTAESVSKERLCSHHLLGVYH